MEGEPRTVRSHGNGNPGRDRSEEEGPISSLQATAQSPYPSHPPRPADWSFVLATDLDGTFLGGSDHQRTVLYDWIADRRANARAAEPGIGLIFVTGRDPGFIEAACAAGEMPWPDYVVGDVGTTIAAVSGGRVLPDPDLEADIRAAWADRGPWVRAALEAAPGLRLQDTEFRYRVSYDWDPAAFDATCLEALAGSGLDVLTSAGRYLDVLPGGVSKGPSLVRTLGSLGIASEKVLVAGDTLNDLSMFRTGLRGAVVGGAEPALLEATANLPLARHCSAPGAAGIAEAIAHFNLHPNPPEFP